MFAVYFTGSTIPIKIANLQRNMKMKYVIIGYFKRSRLYKIGAKQPVFYYTSMIEVVYFVTHIQSEYALASTSTSDIIPLKIFK